MNDVLQLAGQKSLSLCDTEELLKIFGWGFQKFLE